jgi:hypothetical protein
MSVKRSSTVALIEICGWDEHDSEQKPTKGGEAEGYPKQDLLGTVFDCVP